MRNKPGTDGPSIEYHIHEYEIDASEINVISYEAWWPISEVNHEDTSIPDRSTLPPQQEKKPDVPSSQPEQKETNTPSTQIINNQNVGQPSTPVDNPISEDTSNQNEPEEEATQINVSKSVAETVPQQASKPKVRDVLVTEYMLLDNGRRLPHWIEIYNPNTTTVNLSGYTFTYATRQFANYPWTYHRQTLGNFEIRVGGAVILTSHKLARRAGNVEGLAENQVYQLNLNSYVLKNGWLIQDSYGNDVHRIGIAFRTDTQPNLGNPIVPPHVGKTRSWIRQSWKTYPSTDPTTTSYYGKWDDIGSPGFFESAPAAPTLHRKSVGMWADLKKR